MMEQLSIVSRQAAIVAADVAGYTRLMEQDELGTCRRLLTLRRQVLDPAAKRHRGRVVNTSGDGLLLEFSRALDAVRWGIEVQSTVTRAGCELPTAHRLRLRVGVHLARVFVADGDMFGDGVNVAARLQQLAEPGEVWITQAVFERVHDQIGNEIGFLGPRRVKNRSRPVTIWRTPSAPRALA
jgi:adenylate cyclase